MTLAGGRLLELYLPLVGFVLLGWAIGQRVSPAWATRLGQFLFWVGVPLSIFSFLRGTELSGAIWMAPVVAWLAILLGAILSLTWASWRSQQAWSGSARASFMLASMLGNTGYIGYPVALAVGGAPFFAWTLFYDLLGTTVGSYSVGVLLAAQLTGRLVNLWQPLGQLCLTPALWAFGMGLWTRALPLPVTVETALRGGAWSMVALSLVLIGMRLSRLALGRCWRRACLSVGIKMLVVPLALGMLLPWFGIGGMPRLLLILQMAMPPAFATLVIGEVYGLDRDLTVAAIGLGSILLLLCLPFWLWLFAPAGFSAR